MAWIDLPVVSETATAQQAWDTMVESSRSGVIVESGGEVRLVTARQVKNARASGAALTGLAGRQVGVALDRGTETPFAEIVTSGGTLAVGSSVSFFTPVADLEMLLAAGPKDCYCDGDPEHAWTPEEVRTFPIVDGKRQCHCLHFVSC